MRARSSAHGSRRLFVGGMVAVPALALALTAAMARPAALPSPSPPLAGGVPGALPAGFRYVYRSPYAGWPVRPFHEQHPVRGSFLDPRGTDDDGLVGYHFGVDVNVDDERPEPGAPPGLSHRVYAVDSGYARAPRDVSSRRCINRRLDVGHFSYWHVSPVVARGAHVLAGQQIGWTCRGLWHVHVSEWQRYDGHRVWVNPLHRGGRLVPYRDTAAPRVRAIAFFTPPPVPWRPTLSLAQSDSATRLAVRGLEGRVEVRARIGDPQSFLGFLARNRAWPTEFTPYRVAIVIRAEPSGALVLHRTTFQADQLPQTPYLDHYASGTIEADNMRECVGPPQLSRCAGSYWFRPLSRLRQEFWDTRTVPDGSYRVTVRAWDLAGNAGDRSVDVVVLNLTGG